jgi:hypothetical protein
MVKCVFETLISETKRVPRDDSLFVFVFTF